MRCFEETPKAFDGLLEGFGEFALFLIAPRGFQPLKLAVQAGNEGLKVIVEAGQVLGKAAQFRRVYLGFGHEDYRNWKITMGVWPRREGQATPADLLRKPWLALRGAASCSNRFRAGRNHRAFDLSHEDRA